MVCKKVAGRCISKIVLSLTFLCVALSALAVAAYFGL